MGAVVRDGDEVVADTHAPLVLYESGFAPRWYLRRADIVADALEPVEGQTFCPYKALASYYNLGEARTAAWSCCAPFEEVERITDLVSFYPEKVTNHDRPRLPTAVNSRACREHGVGSLKS
jgi:uncharacterized protein (DUF427 family)